MKFIADKSAFKYLCDDFTRKLNKSTWDIIVEMLEKGNLFSERETLKQLKQDVIDAECLELLEKNKVSFGLLTEKDANVLGEMMKKHEFDFIVNSPQIQQRRDHEGLPFVIAMAKAENKNTTLVYRKYSPFEKQITSICKKENIKCLEVEDMLMQIHKN